MRLFIAAELPDTLIEKLSETSASLRAGVRGRYVAPDRFHVTLAFLGETDAGRAGELAALIEDACAPFGPIDVSLGALGIFGRRADATLWQAVESGGALEELAAAIREGLAAQGIPFDDTGFCAHITLMRRADASGGELPMPCGGSGAIDTVALFKSDLTGRFPIYTPLYRIQLR